MILKNQNIAPGYFNSESRTYLQNIKHSNDKMRKTRTKAQDYVRLEQKTNGEKICSIPRLRVIIFDWLFVSSVDFLKTCCTSILGSAECRQQRVNKRNIERFRYSFFFFFLTRSSLKRPLTTYVEKMLPQTYAFDRRRFYYIDTRANRLQKR